MKFFCPECKTTYEDTTLRVCPNDGTRLYQLDEDDPLLGSVIDGRFRIDRSIGHGGMGTVYKGIQLSVGRDVAIKVLRGDLGNKEVALERFFREAKMVSTLTHGNIVSLIDFGQDRDRNVLYLVMELVNGHNLADLIHQGRLRIAMSLDIVHQVCGALSEPHQRNIIHRDLKPENIIIVPSSDNTIQTKVLDFGIARVLESKTNLTGTGMICGTPAYMAPEQAQNEEMDARTDIYALGVILYEMLSGWPPFSGTSSLQIMLKHISEDPQPLRDLIPPAALPPELETLVYEMISKSPEDRPASVLEVRKRVQKIRKRHDLGEVDLENSIHSQTNAFRSFILPKLPRGTENPTAATEVLRRETGMEFLPTISDTSRDDIPNGLGNDTRQDPGLGPTAPLSPEGQFEVALDGGLQTKRGAQQAWTPAQQAAIAKIKDTKDLQAQDGEDPFSQAVTRPTRPRTSTSERPVGGVTNRALYFLAVGMVIVIGLVGLVISNVFQNAQDKNKTDVTKTVKLPTIIKPIEPKVEPPVNISPELTAALVRSATTLEYAVDDAVREAAAFSERSGKRKKKAKRRVEKDVKVVEPVKKKPDETSPLDKKKDPDPKKKADDDPVKGLNLRNE